MGILFRLLMLYLDLLFRLEFVDCFVVTNLNIEGRVRVEYCPKYIRTNKKLKNEVDGLKNQLKKANEFDFEDGCFFKNGSDDLFCFKCKIPLHREESLVYCQECKFSTQFENVIQRCPRIKKSSLMRSGSYCGPKIETDKLFDGF